MPAGWRAPGRNVIAVRVLDNGGGGGIVGEAAELSLSGTGQTLPLAGPWQYQVGLDPKDQPVSPVPGGAAERPDYAL
ncbi:MAG: hypothetical protein WKG07_36600 [Hymenobacter sp.]